MLASGNLSALVRFFNRISWNKGLKARITFFTCFSCLTPWGWNVLEAERLLRSWCHMGWRNTKICIHGASQMKQKHGKCWKLPIFEGNLRVFISYLNEMKIVCSITLLYSDTFYSLFLQDCYSQGKSGGKG